MLPPMIPSMKLEIAPNQSRTPNNSKLQKDIKSYSRNEQEQRYALWQAKEENNSN